MNDTPAASDLIGGAQQLTPEAAREEIKARVSDREFGKRLLSDNPELKATAMAEWTRLHQVAYPPPLQIASIADVNQQAQGRAAEMMETRIATHLKIADMPPAAQEEFRRQQPIAADEQKFAREQIERLKRDKDFVRRLLDGDRQASTEWTRMHWLISLPTASTKTTYPVK